MIIPHYLFINFYYKGENIIMLLSKLNYELQRIISLIHKHNLTLEPFTVEIFDITNDFKYQAMSKTIDVNNKYAIIIGRELAVTMPFDFIMSVICHELGHIANKTANFLCRNVKKLTYSNKGLNYYYKGAEFLADILSIKFLMLSGYKPESYINYLQQLQYKCNIDPDEEDERHPSINRRINAITKLINSRF